MVKIPIKCAGPAPGWQIEKGFSQLDRMGPIYRYFDRVSSYGEYTGNNDNLGRDRSPGSESPLSRETGHLYTCFLGFEINGS
ncbi:hypothetical protein CNMCM5623_008280 [Aspergillus felis]|uniref:Uncharacterized protein n=1 Tax=Aspergillus felis TaxID=1287682 RepID=A0A8H6V556_9EURO|nr:hypothetical protein CNMCM5623_008280 [Aspergillus felis]KAF7179203.1 hypothetical protein CNMCM7691_008134 [Aspergillus felis]